MLSRHNELQSSGQLGTAGSDEAERRSSSYVWQKRFAKHSNSEAEDLDTALQASMCCWARGEAVPQHRALPSLSLCLKRSPLDTPAI